VADGCYRVLALDGGGIRGLIAAEVLREIETQMRRPVAELFDLIAGTSTGGILALGLTKPGDNHRPRFTAADMCDLYLNEGERIFPHALLQEVRTLHGLADARYPAAPLERVLAQHFGETMLSEALREVVIPSYDLTAPGPFFFKRRYAQEDPSSWDVPMAFVARATSAAPTYFDPAVLPYPGGGGEHALVDGGTFANNPTLCGYVDALRFKDERTERVVVVSIGTGLPPQTPGSGPIPIEANDVADFGLVRWARPILEVVLDGVPKAVEYQMRAIRDASSAALEYHRLQSPLPTASHALDDGSPENCRKLVADAATLIADNADTLQQIYRSLA
jgi:predicted acylesterase/phospholipase RssA